MDRSKLPRLFTAADVARETGLSEWTVRRVATHPSVNDWLNKQLDNRSAAISSSTTVIQVSWRS